MISSKGSIVVTGSVAFDYLMRFPGKFVEHLMPDRLDRLSVSFLVDELRRVPGGCAPNIAYGLALLGERPMIFATAGHDAKEYRDWLATQGIDVTHLRLEDDLFTASFFVSSDQDQNQIASFYTGAMARARDLSLTSLAAEDVALVVVSPNDPAAMARYCEECRTGRLPFLYDPSQQVARLSGKELATGLEGAAVLILNDYELGILQSKTGLSAAELQGKVGALVVTHGAEGSTVASHSEAGPIRHQIPAARVEGTVQEPTGVGDAFRAGLLRGLRAGAPWPVAGRVGSVAAVYTLETQGPQPPRYPREAFASRYERNFGKEPWLEKVLAGAGR
ncbi:MAG TPA: carbohydrate kinase family protein [Thermoanaerobaculia bacterium]